MDLKTKPDFEPAMRRIDAWFKGDIIDRAPIRFSKHNAQYDSVNEHFIETSQWRTLKDKWMDAEYQVDAFLKETENGIYLAETFPVFWPNLGPDIYAAFFGCELDYDETTSWSHPIIKDISEVSDSNLPEFDSGNVYLQKIKEMTDLALEKCSGTAITGVTSWCPGIDTVAAWRSPANLCMDMILEPDQVKKLLSVSMKPFHQLFDSYYTQIEVNNLPMVSWMGIPSWGKCHIAQTDFANMISPEQFEEFCLPSLREEIAGMDRVIFHMDGKGVANHLDLLLSESGITAIQWVQGVGDDEPIMQWVPLIKKIQSAGKSLVIDLKVSELDAFMNAVNPRGLFLCIDAEPDSQYEIIRKVQKWK
ncbi:MAG: hypothetical protein AB2L24_19155 [Mangrovibacterium sp.]